MKTALTAVKLGEITSTVDYGHTASSTSAAVGPKFLRITDIQDDGVNWESVPFCECSLAEEASSKLQAGDIVFARTGATTGKSFLIRDCPERAVFASYLIRVRSKPDVCPNYLAHFFKTPEYWSQITMNARGAAQLGVNATVLKSLSVPLLPIAEQKRIAAILDKAEELRGLRRKALGELDAIVQSIFLEMFGDPAKNPKGWTNLKLGDVIHSAKDGPHVSPSYVENGIPFLSARHIRRGEVLWTDLKFISVEDALIYWRRGKPERGDILYTKGGTTGIAKAIDFDNEIAFWVHIALLKPNRSKVEPLWLENMLNSKYCYQQSQRFTHGIANHDLGLNRMVNIELYLPPLTLQQQFARRVEAIEQLKTIHRESLAHLDTLFASLQHRAFRGEL